MSFIRVSNIKEFDIENEKYISQKLYLEKKEHQPKNGEILLTKDANTGIAYHLQNPTEKMIISSGILRLTIKNDKINNDYLTLLLNSIITKEQINRSAGGSIIEHWRPDQIQQTLIPILPKETQKQIQKKVRESLNLYKKSKHLLEHSKQAVQKAIEQNEQSALKWLQAKLNQFSH